MIKEFEIKRDGFQGMSSCVGFPLMTPSEGPGWSATGVPRWVQPSGTSKPATSVCFTVPMASLNPCSLHLSLQGFLLAGAWKASSAEGMSREICNFNTKFPGLWQNCPPHPLSLSLASIISPWRCPAAGGQVQTGRHSHSPISTLSSHATSTTYQLYSTWELYAHAVITGCQIWVFILVIN